MLGSLCRSGDFLLNEDLYISFAHSMNPSGLVCPLSHRTNGFVIEIGAHKVVFVVNGCLQSVFNEHRVLQLIGMDHD